MWTLDLDFNLYYHLNNSIHNCLFVLVVVTSVVIYISLTVRHEILTKVRRGQSQNHYKVQFITTLSIKLWKKKKICVQAFINQKLSSKINTAMYITITFFKTFCLKSISFYLMLCVNFVPKLNAMCYNAWMLWCFTCKLNEFIEFGWKCCQF